MTTSTEPAGRNKTAASKPKAKPVLPHLSVAERVARGKAARAEVPRSRHAKFAPLASRPDPIDLLERSYRERAGAIYGVKGSFLFTSLHAHPRFIALLRKMNLA